MTWEDGAGSASTPGTTVPRTAQEAREPWIDTLRAVAIAGVVVVHSATAYVADFSDWYYAAELDATTVPSAVFGLAALLGGLVGLGPLFLVAGYFSAGRDECSSPGAIRPRGATRSSTTGTATWTASTDAST